MTSSPRFASLLAGTLQRRQMGRKVDRRVEENGRGWALASLPGFSSLQTVTGMQAEFGDHPRPAH